MANTVYHVGQQSFGGGEISPEVANRVDLDKYQYSLLTAKNVYIRPYGPAYKRGGMVYCNETKYANKKAILVEFSNSQDNNNGYLLEIGDKYIRVHQGGAYLNKEVVTPFEESILDSLRFTQSLDEMYITSGKYPVKVLKRNANETWTLNDFDFDSVYFDEGIASAVETADDIKVTPSATSGNITLTSSENLFTANQVGNYMRLAQEINSTTWSATISSATSTSSEIVAGDTWKILTGGTWTGSVTVQRKKNDQWVEYRKYTSKDNYNVTETGTVTEETTLRISYAITSGSVTITLTALPYTKKGVAKITAYTDAKTVSATVVDGMEFGSTDATTEYAWGVWSAEFGYPSCACFFQDRLCFAASSKQPYVVWMSKTGDYHNFSVEEADGKLTDDSAIAASFISRKQYMIKHLVPGTDLLVLTDGNEWLVSGSEVVTPSSMTPRMQTTRGCNDCEPITVGNRIIFIQARGSNVRDMGYTYESDAYVGQDLTLLAEHMIRDKEIVDISYKQEPNSMLYCARNDGKVMTLSYVREQEVYAWSIQETDGKVESLCCLREGITDKVYAVVSRGAKKYLEYFSNDVYSEKAQDYIMLDCAKVISQNTATNTFSATHLKGRTVCVLADGREHDNIEVSADGNFTIPAMVKNVVVGLPFTMDVELPNCETALKDGTTQGRFKMVSNAVLRLRKSLGGSVGASFDVMDDIKYDEFQTTGDVLVHTGSKQVNVPLGGYDKEGRVCVRSSAPYPFMIMAIVREVTFGG